MKKVLVVTSSMGSSSFVMKTGWSNAVPYAVSKAALNMVVAKFATRFKDEGFTFLAVSPGLVKTLPGREYDLTKLTSSAIVPLLILILTYSSLLSIAAEEVEKIYQNIEARLRQVNPKYRGALSVEQSVRCQLELLERMTPADTGAFVHENGEDGNDMNY